MSNDESVQVSQTLSARIALWSAMIAVHSVFLGVAYGVVAARGVPPEPILQLVAWVAFFGMLCSLTATASAVGHLREESGRRSSAGRVDRASALWQKSRPRAWSVLEVSSMGALVLIGATFLYQLSFV